MYAYLIDKKVIETADFSEFTKHFNEDSRIVAKTNLGGSVLSTVFLSVNHGFGDKKLWFETMYFDENGTGNLIARFETYEEAEVAHNAVLNALNEK